MPVFNWVRGSFQFYPGDGIVNEEWLGFNYVIVKEKAEAEVFPEKMHKQIYWGVKHVTYHQGLPKNIILILFAE